MSAVARALQRPTGCGVRAAPDAPGQPGRRKSTTAVVLRRGHDWHQVCTCSGTTMRIQVCTSTDQLAQLRGPWNALLAQAAENTPFLTHEWITAWWRAFGSGSSM